MDVSTGAYSQWPKKNVLDSKSMAVEVPLGRYLSERWADLGINQAEFARRLGKLPAYVQQVRTGKRKPPLKSHTRWAKALELSAKKDLDRLRELMELGHALRQTQEAYERMRAKLDSWTSVS